jgi:hypothetical protein
MPIDDLLIHATGLAALALNAFAMLRRCEKSLRLQFGFAGLLWALNNVLLGAHTAAALNLVSAGRTATSAATLDRGDNARRLGLAAFGLLTVATGALTWTGWGTVFLIGASLWSTYAMFYMTGRSLRRSMLAISALWMYHAWSYEAWEQMAANVLTAAAALYGAWRFDREPIEPGDDGDPTPR